MTATRPLDPPGPSTHTGAALWSALTWSQMLGALVPKPELGAHVQLCGTRAARLGTGEAWKREAERINALRQTLMIAGRRQGREQSLAQDSCLVGGQRDLRLRGRAGACAGQAAFPQIEAFQAGHERALTGRVVRE